MRKSISILGSTGSIGTNTLEIIDRKKKFFKINLLTANKNYKLICSQIKRYNPNCFIIIDEKIITRTGLVVIIIAALIGVVKFNPSKKNN